MSSPKYMFNKMLHSIVCVCVCSAKISKATFYQDLCIIDFLKKQKQQTTTCLQFNTEAAAIRERKHISSDSNKQRKHRNKNTVVNNSFA